MSIKYAKDQPAGFTNRIENVAIIGVSLATVVLPLILFHDLLIKFSIGWRPSWQTYC